MNKLIKRIEFYAFLVPIIAVAFVSISHVTSWYGIANPNSWAIYLSVGIEVAALSALAGFTVGLGRLIYFPFILVTFIQFVGNIFYNFQFIDVESELFKDWVSLVSPLLELFGIESDNIEGHKRVLAFLEGGFLPAISLFFLHLLIKLSEKLREPEQNKNLDIESLSKIAGRIEAEDYQRIHGFETTMPISDVDSSTDNQPALNVVEEHEIEEDKPIEEVVSTEGEALKNDEIIIEKVDAPTTKRLVYHKK